MTDTPPTSQKTQIPVAHKVALGGTAVMAILTAILAVEGGYVANSKDPGGVTNLGITERVARAHGYTGDMRNLTKAFASQVYEEDYIEKPGYAPFLELSPAVAEKLVDSSVNIGPDKPSRWLQTALDALSENGKIYPRMPVDGHVSSKTISAYVALQHIRGKAQACQLVLKSLDAQQGAYYLSISESNPSLQTFTTGWMADRVENVPLSHC